MRHIAIEGMDGVGKTTTARMLAARLGYRYIEKICMNSLTRTIGLTTTSASGIRSTQALTGCLQPGFTRSATFICTPPTKTTMW